MVAQNAVMLDKQRAGASPVSTHAARPKEGWRFLEIKMELQGESQGWA